LAGTAPDGTVSGRRWSSQAPTLNASSRATKSGMRGSGRRGERIGMGSPLAPEQDVRVGMSRLYAIGARESAQRYGAFGFHSPERQFFTAAVQF
jgi:hypothetical protein